MENGKGIKYEHGKSAKPAKPKSPWEILSAMQSVDTAPIPASLESEQSVLGSMLLEKYAIEKADSILDASDFYRKSHAQLFSAILQLNSKQIPVDMVSMCDFLSADELESIGGLPYMASLLHAVPSPANIEYYAKVVESCSRMRKILSFAIDLKDRTLTAKWEEASDIVEDAQKTLSSINSGKDLDDIKCFYDVLDEAFAFLNSAAQNPNGTGINYGLPELDSMTKGMHAGEVVVIGGRPGSGKTAMALKIALTAAGMKHATAFFSLEMSGEQLALRAMCAMAKVPYLATRNPSIWTKYEWERFEAARDQLYTSTLYIQDARDISINQIKAQSRRLNHRGGPLRLIILDYIQIVGQGTLRAENRNDELRNMIYSLRALAQELNVTVVILAQLNRNVEKREDKRPMLSDLSESGGIEAAADVVLFPFRPRYYQRQAEDQDSIDVNPGPHKIPKLYNNDDDIEDAIIYVEKQRNGPCGPARCLFSARYAEFRPLDPIQLPTAVYHGAVPQDDETDADDAENDGAWS